MGDGEKQPRGGERPAGEQGESDGPARPRATDWKQTGCCCEAQADGVPCLTPEGNCEVCGRSVLTTD
jgi:hypothetical protein